MKTAQNLTSVFNIPEIENEDEVDYKKLFQKEKRTRIFYEKKARELESKLSKYMKQNRHLLGRNKHQDIVNIMQEIKSFKGMLPNSVKEIEIDRPVSNHSIEDNNIYSLIKEFAIYGLTDQTLKDQTQPQEKYEGTTVYSNEKVSQILQHSSKLVFPSGTHIQYYSGKEAFDKSMDIINISKQKLKSFVLTFEPTSFEKKTFKPPLEGQSQFDQVINLVNPERRVYAVCVILQDFTVLESTCPPLEEIENKLVKKKSERTVKFKLPIVSRIEDLRIGVSHRAYTIFSYYPFFNFFQELIQSLLYSAKIERYIKYKQNSENLQVIDSIFHGKMICSMLEEIKAEGNQKQIKLNQLIDFNLGPNSKIYLELNRQNCQNYFASDWSYPIISLFTLDVFLDVLTLMVLEQKMVFVCENKTILTYAIFLFTKVLMRPFQYPYPVVNLIPDQEQYLNAPFPIVYGYNKSKQQLTRLKLHKKYKNIYVFFQPKGVSIVCQDSKKKILNNKSPKLRDRLLLHFKRMHKNYPINSLFSHFIGSKQHIEYNYEQNIGVAKEIIAQVHQYMLNDIAKLLPSEDETEQMRKDLINKNVEEQELNQHIFKKIKQKYCSKSRDPFFQAFLQTQLLNVHIFHY